MAKNKISYCFFQNQPPLKTKASGKRSQCTFFVSVNYKVPGQTLQFTNNQGFGSTTFVPAKPDTFNTDPPENALLLKISMLVIYQQRFFYYESRIRHELCIKKKGFLGGFEGSEPLAKTPFCKLVFFQVYRLSSLTFLNII